jgi:cobalt-zinc-cadmium efflux system outer membrane protein
VARHALKHSPALQSLRAELRALEAEIVQAGLLPNPELDLEIENFGGSGSTRGFDGAEMTAALSQKLELAGKRNKRTLVAALRAEALRSEIRGEERQVAAEVDRAFTTLLEAREILDLSERNLARAKEQLAALNAMLDAGTSTRVDVNKAQLAVSEAREQLADARTSNTSAAADLGRLWGGGSADVRASGTLTGGRAATIPANPDAAISKHPTIRAAALRIAEREAAYQLEKARRISDVNVGGGVRQLRDAGETAAVVGVSIPLPVFNRNQGNIRAAEERLDRARAEARGQESELRTQLTRSIAEYRGAKTRANDFDARTVAAAEQALGDTETAYRAGKKDLLEYLDARETLFEVERRQIRARADLMRASSSLKRFTGR